MLISLVLNVNINKLNNFNFKKNFIKYFSSNREGKEGFNDKEWEKLLENLGNDTNVTDDIRNSIEQIVVSFNQININISQSTTLNQGIINNITREEDDPNIITNIEENLISSSDYNFIEQGAQLPSVIDNTNLEGTGTVDSISSLVTFVDVNEYNSNTVLEFFTVERITNAPSLLRQERAELPSPEVKLSTIDLGEQASIRINEARETMEQTIIHFNNILKTKEILLNKMQQQHKFTAQHLNENIQQMMNSATQAHEQASSIIDNISNSDNLNLFTNLFNSFANNLPIKLITYTATGVIGVTLLVFVGSYVLKYNLLATAITSTNVPAPTITINTQSNTSHSGFFSRIGERIVKLLDIFIDYLKDVDIRKYK